MVLSPNKERWIHSPDALINGKVTYNVKFLGVTEVDDPRGMDVVQTALQKLKFSQQIKRAEGEKPPKVELNINIDTIKITNQRTKEVLHDIPLNHVSFCADDKQDKRLFSFITKGKDEKHYCYGLDSLHQANDITLSIGQAFSLAFEKIGKQPSSSTQQINELNKRVQMLEKENSDLKQRLSQLEGPGKKGRSQSLSKTSRNLINHSLVYPSSLESLASIATESNPSTSNKEPNLSIFVEAKASNSTSNQQYLQSKILSNGNNRQANIDQTIASVERAKASLKTLNHFVSQRKLRRRQNADNTEDTSPRLYEGTEASCSPLLEMKDLCDHVESQMLINGSGSNQWKKQKLVRSNSASNDKSYNTQKPNVSSISRRNSDNSLYVGLNEVMDTIQCMMHSDKQKPPTNAARISQARELPRIPCNADELPKSSAIDAHMVTINHLPETTIDDMVSFNVVELPKYENIDPSEVQFLSNQSNSDNPAPPLPPKPKHLTGISSLKSYPPRTESLDSISSTDTSLFDQMSGRSFRLNTPENLSVSLKPSESSSSANFPTGDITATLERFAGEDGYMELKSIMDTAGSSNEDVYVDSMYDSVHKFMSAVRQSMKKVIPGKHPSVTPDYKSKTGRAKVFQKETEKPKKSRNIFRLTNSPKLVEMLKQNDPYVDNPDASNLPAFNRDPAPLSDFNTGIKVGFRPIISREDDLDKFLQAKEAPDRDRRQYSHHPPQVMVPDKVLISSFCCHVYLSFSTSYIPSATRTID
ncbi:unnamed protein product [Clavelina lepadiformis]|uniref:PID domain-containing protein n=1 Tax=Clavelina lepadiformis TaxID=159417 RepID=A0ABP0EX23_CLALP